MPRIRYQDIDTKRQTITLIRNNAKAAKKKTAARGGKRINYRGRKLGEKKRIGGNSIGAEEED